MKTKFLSIAAIITLALGIQNTTFAATNRDEISTVLTDIHQINKIEIHGNVELFVSSASTDQVKVYNKYYAEHALVQNRNGVLRISSYSNEKLVVWVSAADLRGITAYDNAEVKSFGQLSAIDLEVKLYNTASANLDLDAYSAKFMLNDRAKANLNGTANIAEIRYDRSATVNNGNLVAGAFTKAVNENSKPANRDLATL